MAFARLEDGDRDRARLGPAGLVTHGLPTVLEVVAGQDVGRSEAAPFGGKRFPAQANVARHAHRGAVFSGVDVDAADVDVRLVVVGADVDARQVDMGVVSAPVVAVGVAVGIALVLLVAGLDGPLGVGGG